MALAADDTPRIATALHLVGQDISTLSVEELVERIALLRDEVARLEEAKAQKAATRSAADALFSR
ncbi:DUF1192 domain-containing protein [Breoghania sp.]|uniref:DUF1192 domain-containing protein n=1 Tax=Breoghania sp. TaxID=2065378 RepID=UPI002AAB97EF|nr:DUF1192 domain-containing protein [Breoghania sp.]